MGITGLIPFLEKSSRQITVGDLHGSTVAVDAYCWLHKGVVACADKLMNGVETDVHIQYCMKQINFLIERKVRPILVFDGRHLTAKAGVEEERRKNRKAAKTKALELVAAGRHAEARTYFQRALNVSHKMALALIKRCREKGIDCIVAPYESDGQLAYLNLQGIAEYIITEDSDLVLFGCKKVIFKFNFSGGLLVESEKLHLAMGVRIEKFTFDKFRYMCILSGCDYLPSLPGIGLKKANKFFLMTDETDMRRALGRIPNYLNMKQIVVTDEYKESFLKAEATFKHMIVFDPVNRVLTRLNPVGEDHDESLLSNAGEFFDNDTAYQLALGNIDPMTMKTVDDWDPDLELSEKHSMSIWYCNKENGSKMHKKPSTTEIVITEEEIDAKNLKNIRFQLYSKEEQSHEEFSEQDLMASYCTDAEPPPKRLKTSKCESSSNISKHNNPFKRKSVEAENNSPKKSPLKSNDCNTSMLASISKVVPTKQGSLSPETPKKNVKTKTETETPVTSDLFAVSRAHDQLLSPEARKMLETVRSKLRPVKETPKSPENLFEDNKSMDSDIVEIFSPDETCFDSNAKSIVQFTPPDSHEMNEEVKSEWEFSQKETATPVYLSKSQSLTDSFISRLEPNIEIVEDETPLSLPEQNEEKCTKGNSQSKKMSPKNQAVKKAACRAPGLTKKGFGKAKDDTSQKKLSSFGFFVRNK